MTAHADQARSGVGPAAAIQADVAARPSGTEPVLDEPVIVLTGARSGSTLLRLILDAHPDFACPPETNIVKLCAQLASAWNVIEDTPATTGMPDSVAAGIRHTMATFFGDYLARRNKARWCDKSLGTAAAADWLAGLYPRAKFICLYRHGMDVISSGLDAAPWGLMGYGFEQFAGVRQGNNVSALAAYWIEHTGQILEFEQQNTSRCLRVHYERLVADPEAVAAEIFSFLGAAPAPGITARCFGSERQTAPGPGDHKVWATRKITADSVGRGVRIPVGLMSQPQLKVMNYLLTELGYTPVDDAWRTSPCPPPVLQIGSGDAPQRSTNPEPGSLGDSIVRSVLANIDPVIRGRLNAAFTRGLPSAGSSNAPLFDLVAYHPDEQRLARCWRVDQNSRTVTSLDAADAGAPAGWVLTGDVETWMAVLAERANMAGCLRSGRLRYIDLDDSHKPTDVRDVAALARMEQRLASARELLALAGYPEEGSPLE